MGIGLGVQNDITAPNLIHLTTDEQEKRWLPGFCSGEIITATTDRREGAHHVIKGSKTFISNGLMADLVIVACKTDPDAGHRG